jgi:radical SAM protein with 4Fe4S-binding SPASM domain
MVGGVAMKRDTPIGLEVTLIVGCPVACDYCPQGNLLKAYARRGGARLFTLDSFQRCVDSVPIRRQFNFMGASEPFLCPDASRIIRWSYERGHSVGLSTTLLGITREDIDRLADIPFDSTTIHVPGNDGRMNIGALKMDRAYCEIFEYVIQKWRHHAEFVISCYTEPHPALKPIWVASGIPLVHFGLHDREGQIPWIGHQRLVGRLPVCGKLFCGHLFPNGDIARCCGDFGMKNVWGNLYRQTYSQIMDSPAWHQYMRDRQDESKDTPCRRCGDAYKELNMEDRTSLYVQSKVDHRVDSNIFAPHLR